METLPKNLAASQIPAREIWLTSDSSCYGLNQQVPKSGASAWLVKNNASQQCDARTFSDLFCYCGSIQTLKPLEQQDTMDGVSHYPLA